MGIFYPYIGHAATRLIGVEAAGEGIATGRHAASISAGSPGVLHGNRTYLLQDANGQIIETHSISAGLDYPGVGPEHAYLQRHRPRRVRQRHRRRGARRVPSPVPQRRHHPGARIEPRRRLRDEARADAGERQAPARQPLRPRRQGHRDRRRARRAGAADEPHRRDLRGAARARPQGADPVRHRRRSARRHDRRRSCARWPRRAPT